MKDRKTIIESGMLEQYVLGTLPETEVRMLEKLLETDQELKTYVTEIENDLEQVAFDNAIRPPIAVKAALLNQLNNEINQEDTIETKRNGSYFNKSTLAIAAGISILLLVSSLWLFNEWNNSKIDLNVVQETVDTQQERIAALEAELETAALLVKVIKDPSTEQYALKTNRRLPKGKAVAYINHERKYAVVNPQKLPELLEDKTYQMWADVQGEMINMGVIDKKKEVIVLEYVPEATSLNITIEPSGGSDHATVEQLVANVYL